MAGENPWPQFRYNFDQARDPYAARVALGIPDIGSGFAFRISTVSTQVFTVSGTYTPASGMAFCIIECLGGGAGGGGVAGTAGNIYIGAGGGAGSYSRAYKTAAQVGASQTVTIGAGGNGGSAGLNTGSAGGDSSVGTLCVGKGGSGGQGTSVGQNGFGGAGGVAGTGDFTPTGARGEGGFYNSLNTTISMRGGFGANSIWGGGGQCGANSAGGNATNYGSGGGGGNTSDASNFAGGNGSAGIIIITEFLK